MTLRSLAQACSRHALEVCSDLCYVSNNSEHPRMRLFTRQLVGAAALLAACTSAAGNNSNPQSAQILASSFTPPQTWRNVNLVRNINLQKSYPRETINVVIENVGTSAQDEYYLPFEASVVGRVGGLEVRDKNNADAPAFQAETAEYDAYRYEVYSLDRSLHVSDTTIPQPNNILPHQAALTTRPLRTTNPRNFLFRPLGSDTSPGDHRASRSAVRPVSLQRLHALGIHNCKAKDKAQVPQRTSP